MTPKTVEEKAEQIAIKTTHVHNHIPPRDEREGERITARSLMLQRLTESLEVCAKLAKAGQAAVGPPTQSERTANSCLIAIQKIADSVK